MQRTLVRKKGLLKGFLSGILLDGLLVMGLLNPVAAYSQKPIVMGIHESPWLPAYKVMIAMYEKETGNKIEMRIFPHRTMYEKQIIAAVEGSPTFDIMHFDDAWVPFILGGKYATPINEIDPDFKFEPAIIEYRYTTRWSHKKNYSTADGILYAIPVNGNFQLYFYRGDKFKEAGLATPPDTWEDVEGAAMKLHKPPSFYGYATITVATLQGTYFFMPILRSFGGGVFANPPSDWTVTINNEKGKKALEWVVKMVKYCPPGVGNTGQQDVLSYLANGQLAQSINVTAVYPFLDKLDFAREPLKVDLAPLPKGKETGKRSSTLGNWVAVIPKASKNKKAALDFLKWIIRKEPQVKFGEAGGVPIRRDAYEELAAREGRQWRFFQAYLQTFQYAEERPRTQQWTKIDDLIGIPFQEAVTGKISAEEAINKMARDIYAIMKEAGYKTKLISK